MQFVRRCDREREREDSQKRELVSLFLVGEQKSVQHLLRTCSPGLRKRAIDQFLYAHSGFRGTNRVPESTGHVYAPTYGRLIDQLCKVSPVRWPPVQCTCSALVWPRGSLAATVATVCVLARVLSALEQRAAGKRIKSYRLTAAAVCRAAQCAGRHVATL